ncbi:hypothetical protein AMK59_6839, partial [Oryctes borbonicus]
CHPIVNPVSYVEWCQKVICNDTKSKACDVIAAYARECRAHDVCVDWHTELCPAENCPPGQEYKICGSNCPETCEDIQGIQKQCEEMPVEGCFCPPGKVKLNDTCVTPNECLTCDDEGHHPGDTWQKDSCTNCSCAGTKLNCTKIQCNDIKIGCPEYLTPIIIPASRTQCCDTYTCVPLPTMPPTCPPIQVLDCNEDQEKVIKSDDTCEKIVCQCIPPEKCPPLDRNAAAPEEGHVQEETSNGCCSKLKWVCKKETCPEPPKCKPFHTVAVKEIPGKCCPIFECVPPQQCIVELIHTASPNGGEIARPEMDRKTTLKELGESWQDGPCRKCTCVEGYQTKCSVKDCPEISNSPDIKDYVMKYEPIPYECCSEIKRDACKHNGKTYQVNDAWKDETDYCINYHCVNENGDIRKIPTELGCLKDCATGSVYVPATPDSKECCGNCKQVKCVLGNETKEVNEQWVSEDLCTNYECVKENDTMQIKEKQVQCQRPTNLELSDFEYEAYKVPGECCPKYKKVKCKVA